MSVCKRQLSPKPTAIGILARNTPLREAVSERAGLLVESEKAVVSEEATNSVDREEQVTGSLYSSIWVMLLAKIFAINPLLYLNCGGEMKTLSFLTETKPIWRFLRLETRRYSVRR